jgi:hypothetical protein
MECSLNVRCRLDEDLTDSEEMVEASVWVDRCEEVSECAERIYDCGGSDETRRKFACCDGNGVAMERRNACDNASEIVEVDCWVVAGEAFGYADGNGENCCKGSSTSTQVVTLSS